MAKFSHFRDRMSGHIYATTRPDVYAGGDYDRLTAKAGEAALAVQARETLRGILSPGDTVGVVLRHVSASGMMRHMTCHAVLSGNDSSRGKPYIRNITREVSQLCGYSLTETGYLRVGGCGMDMAFAVVHGLGGRMWPDGTPAPHGRRNGEPDSDGGYALKHDWL